MAMNSDKVSSDLRTKTAPDLIRVLDTGETIDALGLSRRTWERLVALGDIPVKTRLSEGRIGYRVCDIREWLDRRRETEAAR
jgi:predicted DNA-binding transcriptional regulator AlpA